MSEVDNQSAPSTDNLETQAPEQGHDSTQQAVSNQTADPYQPFREGKEKFKIDGEELELDWDTTRKYVSLGKTAYKRMQEAADIKNKSQESYKQLLELAKSDPEGLLRALNPNYAPQLPAYQQQQQQRDQVTETDPRDLEIHRVKEELGSLRSFIEKQEIDQERKVIDQELTAASEKYATLKVIDSQKTMEQEYRKALQQGMDVSIDDVAFYVAQELNEMRNKKTQEVTQRLEQKRKQAPVNVISAGADVSKEKSMSLDEVKRLAGRI